MKKQYINPQIETIRIAAAMQLCDGSGDRIVTGSIVTGGNAPLNPGNGL
ncbi:MAG: hypothetical protein II827_03805 [Paludibacteraceae bacterium]|nr:hypothetical protein [Paludibacteraceae bacterium]